MPLPAMQAPPTLTAPAPADQEAEHALLEAFDWERPLPNPPRLKGPALPAYRWLRAAATFRPGRDLPANPFATGSERKEAEALRRLLSAPREQLGAGLKVLPLRCSGTALALWRWGQAQVRAGAFTPQLRRLWEDRLAAAGPALTRSYGLRHAFCWALAEQDEARLASLRPPGGSDPEGTFATFQRLFGLLGGPSPTFRLWTLPSLGYRDLRLDQLGAGRIWICPLPEGPAVQIPAGVAWVIPSANGESDPGAASLPEAQTIEGQALAGRLQAGGAGALFAPSRAAFERLGLAWFPILIEVDGRGHVQSIRMGDAAPQNP